MHNGCLAAADEAKGVIGNVGSWCCQGGGGGGSDDDDDGNDACTNPLKCSA